MNVSDLLQGCAGELANQTERDFIGSVTAAYSEQDIKSPIEQMLYCALRFLQRKNEIPDPDPVEDPQTRELRMYGLEIRPQAHIGRYRVDFLVIWCPWRGESKEVVVECDSQEWHERTAEQRRYEKARDRFLVLKGHKVLHYTGQELHEKAIGVAREILRAVGVLTFDE